jgi:hypothetical protein
MDDYVIANCYQSIGFCQNPGSTARRFRGRTCSLDVPWRKKRSEICKFPYEILQDRKIGARNTKIVAD